ncbi:phytanoyl-CoA dioxygenase family protein [Paenibacillus cremeus]|uniref:Phytanoyl-CoA dioxygenase family protein n=1 Tax=Paenibacillus cremeus TaxID=2163881 RepID=A0A559K967_9BACL|nr:phytanoyl-CoA dioxygenase family protein [Paenibacillus cremeus]TVY08676.1 phytanoyl-CoA dioxygenase family protein [Paenibacillus cremeus]
MSGSVEKQHLLTAKQMADFAVNGYLVLNEVVPQEYNIRAEKEMREFSGNGGSYWNESGVIQEIFNLPQVKGAMQSFVGTSPVYDHSFLHVVRAQHHKGQFYHADSIIDTRPFGYDIQAFYFSHDAPDEMGPTLVLPGSHMRKVSNGSIARYKNILGQRRLVSKAGTIAFLHHAIWHCAQPNFTDLTRYVFKLRMRPGQEQRALFNTEGYNSPEIQNYVYKAGHHAWAGDEGRVNQVQIAKFWRYLTGDNRVDASFEGSLTRMGL